MIPLNPSLLLVSSFMILSTSASMREHDPAVGDDSSTPARPITTGQDPSIYSDWQPYTEDTSRNSSHEPAVIIGPPSRIVLTRRPRSASPAAQRLPTTYSDWQPYTEEEDADTVPGMNTLSVSDSASPRGRLHAHRASQTSSNASAPSPLPLPFSFQTIDDLMRSPNPGEVETHETFFTRIKNGFSEIIATTQTLRSRVERRVSLVMPEDQFHIHIAQLTQSWQAPPVNRGEADILSMVIRGALDTALQEYRTIARRWEHLSHATAFSDTSDEEEPDLSEEDEEK